MRASAVGRITYQGDGAVLRVVRQTAEIVQQAIAFGQYRRNDTDEIIPA